MNQSHPKTARSRIPGWLLVAGAICWASIGWTGDSRALAQCGSAGSGDCCVASGTPECDDASCCNTVCATDPDCCNLIWDQSCADLAALLCTPGTCPGPCPGDGGDCCVANGTPGCDDSACCSTVCAADPFCCDVVWDQTCADLAAAICTSGLCSGVCSGGGPCTAPDATITVEILTDNFGNETTWELVEQGVGVIATGGPYPNNTLITVDVPVCSTNCYDFTIFDAFGDGICCGYGAGSYFVFYNGVLAGSGGVFGASETISDIGAVCGGGSDCCVANGTPGCDDSACCSTVCAVDSFCCDTVWDQACADLATAVCAPGLCPGDCPGDGDCCVANGTPSCNDSACCAAVCSTNPDCCTTIWQQSCADLAEIVCAHGTCPGPCPGQGDCCVANGTPGCDDATCCSTVCATDPFCCDTIWDQICADAAAVVCGPPTDCAVPTATGWQSCAVHDPFSAEGPPKTWCTEIVNVQVPQVPNCDARTNAPPPTPLGDTRVEGRFFNLPDPPGGQSTTQKFHDIRVVLNGAAIAAVTVTAACTDGSTPAATTVTLSAGDTVVTAIFNPPLPNTECCTMTLGGTAAGSQLIKILQGDVNGSGRVNATDKNLVKGRITTANELDQSSGCGLP